MAMATQRRQRGVPPWAVMLLALHLADASRDVIEAAPTTGYHHFQSPRKWTKGTTTAAFCGSAGCRCCRVEVEDEHKLRRAFLAEMKAHGYHDAGCRSELNKSMCTVCLPLAPAAKPFSNTTASTNNDSLPLPCAGSTAPPSVSIQNLPSPSTEFVPPTQDWLPADDDSKAPTTPKLLIALLAFVASLFGAGFVTYKIRKGGLECNNNQCCTNIKCCLCLP